MAFRLGRDVRGPGLGPRFAQALEVGEEEGRIAGYRAAQRRSELVPAERGDGIVRLAEEVARVEAVITEKLIGCAVKFVGALLDRDRDLTAAVAAQPSLGVGGLDAELPHGVYRRGKAEAVQDRVDGIDAVVQERVGRLARPVGLECEAPALAAWRANGRRGRSRNQQGQVQKVSAVQRQADDKAIWDHVAGGSLGGLKCR